MGNDVKYVVICDEGGAIRKFTDIGSALSHLEKISKSTGDAVRGFGDDFMKRLIPAFTAGQLAADGVRKAFGFVKMEITETLEAAIEAEKADRALEASLDIMGIAGFGAAEAMKAYALELQRKTVYDDEAIKSAQALMVQLGLQRGEINEATRGAIGLASVYEMDLAGAARAVTRGFEGDYRALARMIPELKTATTESEKHAAMIDFLQRAYLRAEAEVTTFGGQLEGFKNTYQELQETMGGFITKNESVIETLSGVRSIIEWLNANAGRAAVIKGIDPTNYFGPISYWKSLSSIIGFVGRTLDEDLRNSEAAAYDYNAELGAIFDSFLSNQVATGGWREALEKLRGSFVMTQIATEDLVMVDVAEWAAGNTAWLEELNAVISNIVFGVSDILSVTRDFRFTTPGGQDVWYKEWMAKQTAWLAWSKEEARLAEQSAEGIYGKFESFSDEFYQSITNGFVRAFNMFRLSLTGFKNFFIATWQAIKNAFFQILGDMLAKWMTMAFIKLIGSAFLGGAGGSFFPSTPGSIGMQHGFEGTVTGPKLLYVEPGVTEHVSARPLNRTSSVGPAATTININVQTLDAERFESVVRRRIVPILEQVMVHGDL